MNKSTRLKSVARIAKNRERDAARVLADYRRNLAQREMRLRELQAYQTEYMEQFRRLSEAGAPAEKIQRFRLFIGKLDQAIAEQQRLLASGEQDVEAQCLRWSEYRSKARVLDKAIERFQRQEQCCAERREQGELDETAQRSRRGDDPEQT